MNTTILFNNMNGFETIRRFIDASVTRNLGKFESWRHLDTKVSLGLAKRRSKTAGPVFECEILVTGNHKWFRPIIVKKQNADFYQAFRESVDAAEKVLRRVSKMRISKRFEHKSQSLSPPQEETVAFA